MAKSTMERAAVIFGNKDKADYHGAVGGQKVGDEVQYAFGFYLTLPAKMKNTGDSDLDKVCLLWAKRMVSADNAGLAAQLRAGEITAEEAGAEIMAYDGDGFLVKLNETKVKTERAPKVVGKADLVNGILYEAVATNLLSLDVKAMTKEQAKECREIIKAIKAGTHEKKGWLAVAEKKADAELDRRAKAAKDFT